MHSRSPIQVGPKTPGNDTLAQTACEIGMLLDHKLEVANRRIACSHGAAAD